MFYVLLTAFAAAIAAVDQLTKVLAQQHLTGTTITLVPGWLQLHYITNDGMALSLFRGGRWMFVVLTAVYLLSVVVPMYARPFEGTLPAEKCDPGLPMKLSLGVLCLAMLVMSFSAANVTEWLSHIL